MAQISDDFPSSQDVPHTVGNGRPREPARGRFLVSSREGFSPVRSATPDRRRTDCQRAGLLAPGSSRPCRLPMARDLCPLPQWRGWHLARRLQLRVQHRTFTGLPFLAPLAWGPVTGVRSRGMRPDGQRRQCPRRADNGKPWQAEHCGRSSRRDRRRDPAHPRRSRRAADAANT
jgi:hypothetical protein